MAIFFNEFKHLKIQLEEIKSATDNFGDNNLIGRGGFGKVYKGTISHSKGQIMAAFKRLDSALGQGNSEFWKEITMLSRYTHENLVSLLGYCDVGDEKILVYEYASRGSLDRHLSDTALTWMQRLRICLGAARGLSYLHDPKGTQQRVLHRDIKSSNILLDENWNAKVSDFGLSRLSPANQEHTILISNMVGTVGYLDPLYLEMGLLTKESDVYSFGVVLFEVLCGRLCYEFSNSRVQTLVRLWKKSYKQKKLDEIIFQDMLQQMDPSSLETFSDISYLCLNKSLEERPMMAHVVKELEIALDRQVTYEQRIHYAEMNRNNQQPCLSKEMHEKCANLAPVIHHHLHPKHPLTLIVRDVNGAWRCDVCYTRGLVKGFSYGCMSCDFDACTECGLAIVLEHEVAIALELIIQQPWLSKEMHEKSRLRCTHGSVYDDGDGRTEVPPPPPPPPLALQKKKKKKEVPPLIYSPKEQPSIPSDYVGTSLVQASGNFSNDELVIMESRLRCTHGDDVEEDRHKLRCTHGDDVEEDRHQLRCSHGF